MKFVKGQGVKWTSQGGGILKEKVGVIVGIIPAYHRPTRGEFPKLYSNGIPGNARDHVSYIVQAGTKMYWPVVTKLQPIGSQVTENTIQSKPKKNLINIIGFSLDYSRSMSSITGAATRDYNSSVDVIRDESRNNDQTSYLTVIKCGVGRNAYNEFMFMSKHVDGVDRLSTYRAAGSSTPLFASVLQLISRMESESSYLHRDASNDISYMVQVITDGQDNASSFHEKNSLVKKIAELQATDRWTFVFRVPRGYKNALAQMGIPADNIMEWEQTNAGFEKATQVNTQAYTSHFTARSAGLTSSQNFYTNLAAVPDAVIKNNLTDIGNEVKIAAVNQVSEIRPFVEKNFGHFLKGAAFYELVKTEEVQDYKKIIVRDTNTGRVYAGHDARQVLNLPRQGTIKLRPGNNGHYEVYVQSTSVNRKMLPGTKLAYWTKAV